MLSPILQVAKASMSPILAGSALRGELQGDDSKVQGRVTAPTWDLGDDEFPRDHFAGRAGPVEHGGPNAYYVSAGQNIFHPEITVGRDHQSIAAFRPQPLQAFL